MKRILVFLFLLATFASAQQTDSTDILITVREDGDTLQTGRWRSGMPVRIRDSWNGWGERERLANKFVIVRVGVEKSRIDSFLVEHTDSASGLRRKYQLSRSAIQFVKNNRDSQNVVRVTPAQLRNAFKRANRLRRLGEPQRMGILTPDLFIRWRNMLIAATETSVTVNTDGGGDYTSLAAAEAGEQDDLVTANEQITFNCSGTTADGAAVFAGWTTDATRIPIVQGNNISGIFDNSKYTILAGNYANAITTSVPNIVFANLQLQGVALSYTGINATAKTTIMSCIIKDFDATNQGAITLNTHTGSIVLNNILDNCSRGIFINNTGGHYIYNNTIHDCDQHGILTNYAGNGVVYTNNLVSGCAVNFLKINAAETTNGSNNLSSDATLFGTDGYINQTVNFADTASGDFSLQSGYPGINQGADLTADGVTTDIRGVVRPQGAAFDVGAFELASEPNTEKRNGWNGWLNKGFKGRY